MRKKLEKALLNMRFALERNFFQEERGDSNMVAVIVLIVIVLAVAGMFQDSLLQAVRNVMDRFIDFIG